MGFKCIFLMVGLLLGAGFAFKFKQMNCPIPDSYESVYYPDLEDCTRFYQCFNGNPILMNCAPGTVFNATLNVCVHPRDTSCNT
ncbi:hypothetical protein FQR65_LT07313 [Abscondita terminalis]|nr:hypothetical protein FQR65_LT07313 [Abscondita terminalis]